jgi:hypothetical protein
MCGRWRTARPIISAALIAACLGCDGAAADGEAEAPPVSWLLQHDPSTQHDCVTALALDGDDLVVAGADGTAQEADPGDLSWRIERVGLDLGRVWERYENPSPRDDRVASVALAGDALYVASHEATAVSGDVEWRIERRDAVDDDPVWSERFSSADDREHPADLVLDGTGLYAVGYAQPMRFDRWRIEKRRLDDGALIWTWEASHEEFDNHPNGVAVSGARVFVGGTDRDRDSQDGSWRVQAHDTATGALAWEQTSNPSSRYDQLTDVAAFEGTVLSIGTEHRETRSVWRIERRDALDGAFEWAVTGVDGIPRAVVMDERGIFVVGHERFDPRSVTALWRVERRDPTDGALLWSDVMQDPEHGSSEATAAALDARGLIIGGWDTAFGEQRSWRVERRDL